MTTRFCFFNLSLVLISLVFLRSASADLVADTCKEISQSGGVTLPYDFCVAALNADPGSQAADLAGLGVISLKLSKANATYVRSYIDQLLAGKKYDEEALKTCAEEYDNALDNIEMATLYINRKDYNGANIQVSAAFDVPQDCEDTFKERPDLQSPLTKEDDVCTQLFKIALNITKKLSGR
ncbi:hypothetical protein IFM89_035893 [Coptis chinensis]|uniref:Pectinesterase inhibitor domain-containing protein n=1 Tax=Coptis chinensis TaxID=261450 RepID=A0A835LDI4_9MAGN|nr:hypothetical protein IFM89_035893 [Coptis chinensis]